MQLKILISTADEMALIVTKPQIPQSGCPLIPQCRQTFPSSLWSSGCVFEVETILVIVNQHPGRGKVTSEISITILSNLIFIKE